MRFCAILHDMRATAFGMVWVLMACLWPDGFSLAAADAWQPAQVPLMRISRRRPCCSCATNGWNEGEHQAHDRCRRDLTVARMTAL